MRAAPLWGLAAEPLLDTGLLRSLTCPGGSGDSAAAPSLLLPCLKYQPGSYLFSPRQMPMMGGWERDDGPDLIDKGC